MAGCNQEIVPGSSPNDSIENVKDQGEGLLDGVKGELGQEISDFEADTEEWILDNANNFFTEETSTTQRVD
ncbi:hypothetical protein [Salimicrobium flavidum]|uniref:Uncharacterized protein n=1 Tax=Salimicrobium flavidum TaxID=570947 RepID=A0A1N7KCX1_9BACI|nr:hypothetical protein [Salimicrobium flavidum]SIS59445.1 hypothetical protein SAMN05421687_11057 [Salimicrobium flavidum]